MVKRQLEGRYGSDQYQVIMDRGLFDALAWFELLQSELLQSRGGVTAEECVTIQSFLLVGHWRKLIDLVFLFQTDPDTSLDRENRDKLIDEPGQAMNPAFLENLNRAYVTIKDKYAGQFNQLYDVDTGSDQKTTPQSTAYEVARNIVHHIRMKAEAHNAG